MSKRLPPVPPAGRSPKGPGNQEERSTGSTAADAKAAPDNLKSQDRQGNIAQNTTHQGYQQDR